MLSQHLLSRSLCRSLLLYHLLLLLLHLKVGVVRDYDMMTCQHSARRIQKVKAANGENYNKLKATYTPFAAVAEASDVVVQPRLG
jgi:hypothetical protein